MRPSGLKRRLQFAGFPRSAILLTTLIAFIFQGYVTQTHIHHKTDGFTASAGESGHKHKVPGKDDESNCLFCQAVAHSGQFVSPAAIAFGASALWLALTAVQTAEISSALYPSHSWYCRGPPRA